MANSNGPSGLLKWLSQPVAQMGFAGFAILLLGILVWRMHVEDRQVEELHALQRETNKAVVEFTVAVKTMAAVLDTKLDQ